MNGEECGKLECEHYFHMKCIKKWFTKKNMCPLCKCMGLAIVDELIDGWWWLNQAEFLGAFFNYAKSLVYLYTITYLVVVPSF